MKQQDFVAYDAANNEREYFDSHKAATAWLLESIGCDGISQETEDGYSYIAQITHRTQFEVTHRKEDYHEHSDDCPDDCDLEEWPHDNEFDYVGDVTFRDVSNTPPQPLVTPPATDEEDAYRCHYCGHWHNSHHAPTHKGDHQ